MRRRTIIIVVVVLVLALGIDLMYEASKHNHKSTNNTTTGSNASSSTANTTVNVSTVEIKDFSFTPANITVHRGSTVTWVNDDTVNHTVTSDAAGGPSSSSLDPGSKYQFRFDSLGTFKYHCSIHTDMTGSVTVTN